MSRELFVQLDREIKEENYENAVKIANRILASNPADDQDALKVKIICLIQLEQFDNLLSVVKDLPNRNAFVFEEAYALYRLKKLTESFRILELANQKDKKILELKAQVFYSMEKYQQAVQVYETILQLFGQSNDVITNLGAALVKSRDFDKYNKLLIKYPAVVKETFEFAYNTACSYIENGDYTNGEKYLDLAQSICRVTLTRDGFTKEEIDDEIAIIRSQYAYVLQKKGNHEEAIKIYNELENSQISDLSVFAVVENNLISLREGDRFDSLRKLNKLRTDKVQAKLLSSQKQTVGFNLGLILQQMNKNEECKEVVSKLQKEYPSNDLLPLLSVSVLMKEKKVQKAQELLEEFATEHPQSSLRAKLSIAQLHLSQGNTKEVIQILESIESLRNTPVMICTLVALYQKLADVNGAIKVLDYGVKALSKDSEFYTLLLKKNADYKFSCGLYKEASTVYKQLLKLSPTDLEALSSLVIACSYFDPEQARKLENKIPALESDVEFDPEQLENISVPTAKRKEYRKEKKETTDTSEISKNTTKIKKKKKRKNKPPKHMDPNKPADPERWLPKCERSNFKGRRKGKGKDRGAQGAIAASHAVKTQEASKGSKPAPELVEEAKIHNPDGESQPKQTQEKPNHVVPGRRGGKSSAAPPPVTSSNPGRGGKSSAAAPPPVTSSNPGRSGGRSSRGGTRSRGRGK